ncbi:MAG: HDOD domain-containing protein [Puniceicoccaceae bacterium]
MPLDENLIQDRIRSCPRLGSLRRINSTFQDLANADQDYTGQIAEIIRRDPSLTSRLLQMVNSVFYGLREKVSSVEDAVFYLGTKQIREMALATPVLEDMQRFAEHSSNVDWTQFWQQSIGCAIMTRELLSYSDVRSQGDSDYISGLIYGVGYLVAVAAFPNQMHEVFAANPDSESGMEALLIEHIGWTQSQIGGFYLESNNIPEAIRMPVRFQNEPELAEEHAKSAAALYLAKRMIGELQQQRSDSSASGPEEDASVPFPNRSKFRIPMPDAPSWDVCPEFHLLIDAQSQDHLSTAGSLRYTLGQLPGVLKGLV